MGTGTTPAPQGPPAGRLLREAYPNESELQAATAFVGTARAMSHIAAQGLSGVLVYFGSPTVCFAVNGASFVVFAVCVAVSCPSQSATMPVSVAQQRETLLKQLGQGVAAVTQHSQFAWALSNYAIAWFVVIQPFMVLAPAVLLAASAERGALIWGWVGAAIGLGGIAGGLLVGRVRRVDRLTFVVMLGLCDVPLFAVLAVDPTNVAVYVLAFVTGVQSTMARIMLHQELYLRIAPSHTSRVQSLLLSAWLFPAFLASLTTPVVAGWLGLRGSLILLATLFLLVNAGMTLKVWRHRPSGSVESRRAITVDLRLGRPAAKVGAEDAGEQPSDVLVDRLASATIAHTKDRRLSSRKERPKTPSDGGPA